MGSAQSATDYIKELDQIDAEWATSTASPASPPLVFHEDTDHSVNNVSVDSRDIHLDQSNYKFAFVDIHWASFNTGLSSILAVILSLSLIAGCCYFRGHHQRQLRARHTELLRTAIAGAMKNVSSTPRT